MFADDTPLLGKDGATVATSVNSDEREEGTSNGSSGKPANGQLLKSMTVLLVAAGGAAAYIASFILHRAIIVYVAGVIGIMNFPLVTYKERKLLRLPSRRKVVDQLEETVERLRSEADFLEDEIEQLITHAARFGNVEHELEVVAREQGSNVDEIVELVRVNDETMDLMRESLRQKVIEDVVEIVIRSEKSSKQRIDRVEAKLLALKITVKLEAIGVTFDEDKFLQAVALNPTLWGIAGTVRKLLPPEDGHHDEMSIVSDKDDVYDMFYMTRDHDQQRRGSGGEAALGRPASLAMRRHFATGRA